MESYKDMILKLLKCQDVSWDVNIARGQEDDYICKFCDRAFGNYEQFQWLLMGVEMVLNCARVCVCTFLIIIIGFLLKNPKDVYITYKFVLISIRG